MIKRWGPDNIKETRAGTKTQNATRSSLTSQWLTHLVMVDPSGGDDREVVIPGNGADAASFVRVEGVNLGEVRRWIPHSYFVARRQQPRRGLRRRGRRHPPPPPSPRGPRRRGGGDGAGAATPWNLGKPSSAVGWRRGRTQEDTSGGQFQSVLLY